MTWLEVEITYVILIFFSLFKCSTDKISGMSVLFQELQNYRDGKPCFLSKSNCFLFKLIYFKKVGDFLIAAIDFMCRMTITHLCFDDNHSIKHVDDDNPSSEHVNNQLVSRHKALIRNCFVFMAVHKILTRNLKKVKINWK